MAGVAARYAAALFDLAQETNAADAVKIDLERFDALVEQTPDLDRLVRVRFFLPRISSRRSRRYSTTQASADWLRNSSNSLPPIAVCSPFATWSARYRELVARHKGEATANVTVAEQLKPEHLAALRDALKAVSGKDVDLDVKVDPAIIGGLVVKLGSRMVDASLRTKLNAIKHAMKEAR